MTTPSSGKVKAANIAFVVYFVERPLLLLIHSRVPSFEYKAIYIDFPCWTCLGAIL